MDVLIRTAPRTALRIVREPDGMFSCARQEMIGLPGCLLRTDRWLDGNGADLGITTGLILDPRVEDAATRLTWIRNGRPLAPERNPR